MIKTENKHALSNGGLKSKTFNDSINTRKKFRSMERLSVSLLPSRRTSAPRA